MALVHLIYIDVQNFQISLSLLHPLLDELSVFS